MNCPKCGSPVPARIRSCNICGAEIPADQPQQSVYTQPTIQQQLYEQQNAYRPAPQYQPAPQQPAPKKSKKKFPVLVLVIALAVLLIAAAALLLTVAFGKETVYLMTEQISEDQTSVTTYTYDFTEDGKLLFYQVETKYKEEYSDREDTLTVITYSYDKKGVLESVEFELNGESYEYEYIYDKNGYLKTLEGDDQKFKIKCDDKGRITSVKSAADDFFSGKYSYHDNGILKKATIVKGVFEMEYRYDEQGKLLRSSTSLNGRTVGTLENKYDEQGRITENVSETYSYGELLRTTTISYGYGDGLFPVTYGIEVSMDEGFVALDFETEDEGLERTFELVDLEISGYDVEMPEDMKDAMDRMSIEMVFDEHGNLLECDMDISELDISINTSYSYVAVKVPKNYAMIYYDPIYFRAIDASRGAPASAAPAVAETMPAGTEAAPYDPNDP